MNKGARSLICTFVLACGLLSGCADMEILEKIPGEFVFYREDSEADNQPADAPQSQSASAQDSRPAETSGQAGDEAANQPPAFLMAEAYSYAYDCLSEAEQIWYRDMERLLGSMEETGELSKEALEAGLDETHIDKIFQYVLCDHPELFFVDGYSYMKYTLGDEIVSIEFSGSYNLDYDTALQRKTEIETAAAEMLSGISREASEYEKVKYVYETLIARTDYEKDAGDSQNIYSVFVHHLSVCQGYAKAAQYLLNQLGVECVLILGTVDSGEGHAWNLVKVDGSYYYVDTTWGDVSYRLEDGENLGRYLPNTNYDYLNVTTADLLRTHSLGELLPVPECTATEANYYVKENALFSSYDKEKLKELFARAEASGRADVTIKCADEACYEEILRILIEEQEIFDYMKVLGNSVAFTQNKKQLSLTFWVTNE